jgi:hypothetical protein
VKTLGFQIVASVKYQDYTYVHDMCNAVVDVGIILSKYLTLSCGFVWEKNISVTEYDRIFGCMSEKIVRRMGS